ncbi:hypothetical protein OQI_29770 [Streptomyces pharetrae CZA14]|uniref:Uncharacterized protein n=1 Tax=Streptomyces pharetrae CZA14 TaxID=1144883 RepID=A0ABX3YAT7_9ACTN|nr:hypothetical protein OQI_29770 [Streptomyces pharetrae CZA14]
MPARRGRHPPSRFHHRFRTPTPIPVPKPKPKPKPMPKPIARKRARGRPGGHAPDLRRTTTLTAPARGRAARHPSSAAPLDASAPPEVPPPAPLRGLSVRADIRGP